MHRETMILVDSTAGELRCHVDRGTSTQSCSANCIGCSQVSGAVTPIEVSLPVSLLPSSTVMIRGSFELEVPGEMLIALSSLVYLLPVSLMLLFSVCCGIFVSESEGLIAMAAVTGFGIGAGAVILLGDKIRQMTLSQLAVCSKQ